MQKAQNKKILVIDDEEAIVLLLETVLGIYGYSTVICTRPLRAVQTASEHQPDLIILDVAMPEKDGYDVCVELKNNPATSHIPIIMVTALALIQDKKKGFASGANGFIFKPFDPMVVVSEIEKLIR